MTGVQTCALPIYKDDNTSKEFYFLGEINAIGEPKAIVMKNVEKNAVEITYELETAVREDLYEYLVERVKNNI